MANWLTQLWDLIFINYFQDCKAEKFGSNVLEVVLIYGPLSGSKNKFKSFTDPQLPYFSKLPSYIISNIKT